MLPCIIHEDAHLLVVNKPPGMNTHAPGPYSGEGLYEWLRGREARWRDLAIIHRLDKVTSGVLVFAKTPLASRELTRQFEQRAVQKRYVLLTAVSVSWKECVRRSRLARLGDRYASRASGCTGEWAETRFRVISASGELPTRVEAEPLTGRTHQIRVHAAEGGFPVLGDELYGGARGARVCLHARELRFEHPETGCLVHFVAPETFANDPALELRRRLVEPEETDAYRLVHGAADGWPGWYVERLGEYLLSQGADPLSQEQLTYLRRIAEGGEIRGAYHKRLNRQVRRTETTKAGPQLVFGDSPGERFAVRENGLSYRLSFQEGYSVGLFLDQRDNRRRVLESRVAGGFEMGKPPEGTLTALNTFAYTCGFSVCAARAGYQTVSVDLSRKYLDWGRENFGANGLALEGHEFLYGEVFDWLRRFQKKRRKFSLVILDPPTFSQSRDFGVFRVEHDYAGLAKAAAQVVSAEGVMFCSANAADWPAEQFLKAVRAGVASAGRRILQQQYSPQAPDFPVSREEPAHLKTVWVRLA